MIEFCLDWIPAAVSALFAGLAFLFSRIPSGLERLETLKLEILAFLTTEGLNHDEFLNNLGHYSNLKKAASYLGKKYTKARWSNLLMAAVIELKNSGHEELFSLSNAPPKPN